MLGQTNLQEEIQLAKAKITVTDNGPYIVTGAFELVDADGHAFETTKETSLCRCGYSGERPYCDGTHEEIDFKSTERANDLMLEV